FCQECLFQSQIEDFLKSFDLSVEYKEITINFSNTYIWDDSAVSVLDKVVSKYREKDNEKRNVLKIRSEEHTSELQSRFDLVCRLLLEKKKIQSIYIFCNIR